MLFLDKCCVDQQDVRRSLRGLPVYIGGSRELLCCVGPTYCSRLWCASTPLPPPLNPDSKP